jgi:hypothetical protein
MARISNTTLSRNTAHFGGGGIYNGGNMTINGSTVLGNNAFLGAGLDNVGTLAINNSTVGVNTGYQGGGLSNAGSVAISNSTISQNTGVKGGGIDNGVTRSFRTALFRTTMIKPTQKPALSTEIAAALCQKGTALRSL